MITSTLFGPTPGSAISHAAWACLTAECRIRFVSPGGHDGWTVATTARGHALGAEPSAHCLRPRDSRRTRDGSGLQPRWAPEYRALGWTHRRHHEGRDPRPGHDRRTGGGPSRCPWLHRPARPRTDA